MRTPPRPGLVAVLAAVAIAATACASERSMDNPPPISPEVLATIAAPSTPPPTQPTTTAFVPSTAPTTVAPPTQPPPPATYAPTLPTPASQTTAPTTPPPTSATTVPDTLPERYTVVAGDCWSCIARKLGVEMDALLAANGMNSSSLILPGETLAVPTGGAVPAPTEGQTSPPTQAPQQTDPPTQPPTVPPPPPGNGNGNNGNGNNGNGNNGNGNNGNNGNGNNGNGNNGNGDDGSAGGSTLPPTPGAVRPAETSAACQAEDSEDARGNSVSFSPGNLFDRDTGTAWRCAPDAELQLTFRFDGPTHLTSVGLINGYAKVDPETEIDRYIQNHRVRTATWTFSDGSSVTQDFADNNRGMQSMPVDVTTDAVTLTITAHYPNGGPGPRDFVAIAELELIAG